MPQDPKIFFVISFKNDRGEVQSSTLSIQDLKNAEELYQVKSVRDEATGKYKLENFPLIAMNYTTSVKNINAFKNTARIKITHRTKAGVDEKVLDIDEFSTGVYEDDSVKIFCGVATLTRIPDDATVEEEHAIIRSITEVISRRIGRKIDALSNNSEPEPIA